MKPGPNHHAGQLRAWLLMDNRNPRGGTMRSSHLLRVGIPLVILGYAWPVAAASISTVSFDVGIMRHLQIDHLLPEGRSAYTLYPELQIGGSLAGTFADWRLFWGHWDDGIEEPFPGMDLVTYSHSGHVLGARLLLFARRLIPTWQFPIHMALGLSHQFVDGNYVGGHDLAGNAGEDFSDEVTYVEAGCGLSLSVSDVTRGRFEVSRHVPLGEFEATNSEDARWAFKAGVDFRFR